MSKRRVGEALLNLYETGKGLDLKGIRGTKWAMFNAVTEFVDHERTVRARAGALDSAWFGSGALLKQRAWDLLTK